MSNDKISMAINYFQDNWLPSETLNSTETEYGFALADEVLDLRQENHDLKKKIDVFESAIRQEAERALKISSDLETAKAANIACARKIAVLESDANTQRKVFQDDIQVYRERLANALTLLNMIASEPLTHSEKNGAIKLVSKSLSNLFDGSDWIDDIPF